MTSWAIAISGNAACMRVRTASGSDRIKSQPRERVVDPVATARGSDTLDQRLTSIAVQVSYRICHLLFIPEPFLTARGTAATRFASNRNVSIKLHYYWASAGTGQTVHQSGHFSVFDFIPCAYRNRSFRNSLLRARGKNL